MHPHFYLLLVGMIGLSAAAQQGPQRAPNIGDPAPPLRVKEWLKGGPVTKFERGMAYVVEYWATWCRPCRAAMPRLSVFARKYKDKITVIGMDVYEMKTTSLQQIQAFVDSMALNMDYLVATQDSAMATAWIQAFQEENSGIPRSFVVDAQGKMAWIGHPKDLERVLQKVATGSWDIKAALAKHIADKRLQMLDDSLNIELLTYWRDMTKPTAPERPVAALVAIDEIVKNEPDLKYAPSIAYNTFSALLKTDPRKAFEYGKAAIATPTYEEPAYSSIIGVIKTLSRKLSLPAEIYGLGAEAAQAEIDQFPYPELLDLATAYNRIAEWYWLANEKSKAIAAQQKAIKALKDHKSFSGIKMRVLESRLHHYRLN